MRNFVISALLVSTSLAHAQDVPFDPAKPVTAAAGVIGAGVGALVGSVGFVSAQVYNHQTLRQATVAGLVAGAGAAVLTGGTALALSCAGAAAYSPGERMTKRYLNCLAAPLTVFNRDPRDRMYLSAVESCAPDRVTVVVQSTNGGAERREFTMGEARLARVEMSNLNGEYRATMRTLGDPGFVSGEVSHASGEALALSKRQLGAARALVRDHEYYRFLCDHDELIPRVADRRELRRRAFDAQTLKRAYGQLARAKRAPVAEDHVAQTLRDFDAR